MKLKVISGDKEEEVEAAGYRSAVEAFLKIHPEEKDSELIKIKQLDGRGGAFRRKKQT